MQLIMLILSIFTYAMRAGSFVRPKTSAAGNVDRFRMYSVMIEERLRIEPSGHHTNPIFTTKHPFDALCKSSHLLEALVSKKLYASSDIQGLSYQPIFDGKNVVIGAETGSGKTLSYILPLLDRYLVKQSQKSSSSLAGIILAPTNSLCDQIIDMTNFIKLSLIERGYHIQMEKNPCMISSFGNTQDNTLKTIVCTPRLLLDQIKHVNPKMLSENPLCYLQFLVLDEADMLLDGSYLTDILKIFEKLKLTRRQMIHEGLLKAHDKNVQYILSAATLSTHGTKSIASQVQSLFPNITHIRTSNMHCHHPSITQEFIKISTCEDMYGMVDIVIDEIGLENIEHGTMIFLNTAERAQRFAVAWRTKGRECAEVHGLQNRLSRTENLALFKEKRVAFLICTDACARGLDFPHVKTVVQVDFALNIVQHLHRIGRASRAGANGFAFNFYGQSSRELVNSVTDISTDSTGIEKSFSRRRGFRQKLKRGRFP